MSQKASNKKSLKKNSIAPLALKGSDTLTKCVDNDMEDLADANTKIRKQIIKWQHEQNDVHLRQLKEHKDYEVQIVQSVHPKDLFTAAIFCTMCSKKIHLGVNHNSSVKLSNWVCHVKTCVQEKRQKKDSQLIVTKYFSSSSNSVLSPDITSPDLSEISTQDVQTASITDVPSAKSATSMPQSTSSDQDSVFPSAKSGMSMPECSGSNQGFQGAPPIAKK